MVAKVVETFEFLYSTIKVVHIRKLLRYILL